VGGGDRFDIPKLIRDSGGGWSLPRCTLIASCTLGRFGVSTSPILWEGGRSIIVPSMAQPTVRFVRHGGEDGSESVEFREN